MKYANLIKITVFSYEHENSEAITDALLRLLPFNIEDNKITLKRSTATGFNQKRIGVLEITLTKPSLINQFLKDLLNNLDKNQQKEILSQAESRLDKDLNFFLRFDKGQWLNEKKLLLTDSGKCFHIKNSIAAFPKKREVALSVVRNLFSQNEIH